MADILGIGISGLNAAQRALSTTGNNISNVNTPGYTRQRVDLSTRQDQNVGGLAVGKGVDVESINRVMNEFLTTNVRNSGTNVGQMTSYNTYSSQIDGILSDDVSGLSSSLQSFFDAVNGVADDPASVPARQAMLSQAESLTAKFNTLNSQLDQFNTGVNSELRANVARVNELTRNIAEINQNISQLNGRSDGNGSNSLYDQREQALNELASLVGVNSTQNSDGTVSVMTTSGQVLVSGVTNIELDTKPDPLNPSQLDVTYRVGGSDVVVTNTLSGGEIGGLIEVREDVIDETRNALGRLGAGLALAFNSQQALGEDLDGVTGVDLFSLPSPSVAANAGVTGVLDVSFDPASISDLTTSDYRVSYDGTNYTATRLSDNTQVYSGPGTAFSADGLDFNFSTGAAAGDTYLVQPMQQVARQISTATSDPRVIAAAGVGTGIGDNANALAMADLQVNQTLEGGNASLTEAYTQLIGDVGSKARQAKTGLESMEAVQASAIEARDSVSGVSLDEEAADLLKFQQAYQAAARVIAVGNEIFGTLLQATGR